MKTVRNSLLAVFSIVVFSGCYTELATVEQNDREYAYDSDTTVDEGSTTINNHYYLDDDYRRSRLRVSFHYYYPENTSWIGGYYNSFFNDPYWGMRPWAWSYDPWYGYYPAYYPTWGCYPYDPWHPYYPPVAYYPVYYPTPIYVNNQPAAPPRIRTEGSSRDGNNGDVRSRPITPPTEVQTTTIRTGRGNEKDVTPVATPVRKRDNEVSWWDRRDTEQPKEAQPVNRPREIRNPTSPEKQGKRNDESVPTEQPRGTGRPTYTPAPKESTPDNESRPVDRPREVRRPTYTPAPKSSVPKEDAKPVERPRQSGRQSYNPPPAQSAPSAPPQSTSRGGSSGSSSSGGRKRD
jgi:hypothetical protein